MFKLPDDIEIEMGKLYPGINISLFIHQLFTKIIDKTLQGGACSVRGLGKYMAYQTFSAKLARNVIRLKFVFSIAFLKKIRFDELLMETLPVKDIVEFGEKHEAVCSKTRHKRVSLTGVRKSVTKSEPEATMNNLGKLEIMKILNDE